MLTGYQDCRKENFGKIGHGEGAAILQHVQKKIKRKKDSRIAG